MKYLTPEGEDEVLPNLLNTSSLELVQKAETKGFLLAEASLLDELRTDQQFDAAYIQEIHRRALSQVYEFAGRYRNVNMSKAGFPFPAAQFLSQGMAEFERNLLRRLPASWATSAELVRDIAQVHAELLYIHPFREGNGRTARILANMMAYKNGSASFQWEKLAEPARFTAYVRAVQAAADMNYQLMERVLTEVLPPADLA
jgi:cell filamentation protein